MSPTDAIPNDNLIPMYLQLRQENVVTYNEFLSKFRLLYPELVLSGG